MVDFVFRAPGKPPRRIREVSPVNNKRGAEEHERQLRQALQEGTYKQETPDAPTLSAFGPRWLANDARANMQRPSTIAGKEKILRVHLYPALGERRLDQISAEDIGRLKASLVAKELAPNTINNVLVVLRGMLKTAKAWELIASAPEIAPVRAPQVEMEFYEEEDLERLARAAERCDRRIYLVVLLGADAGLRASEMLGLEWGDLRFTRDASGRVVGGQMRVQRQLWKGQPLAPKGGRGRAVPLTARLAAALAAHQHLEGPRVLYRDGGSAAPPPTERTLQRWIQRAERRAGMRQTARVHILRHTFCSRLALRGVPAATIQALAGHRHIMTTMRYMHLSPSAIDLGIRALEARGGYGNLLATQDDQTDKPS
jgi:integrase